VGKGKIRTSDAWGVKVLTAFYTGLAEIFEVEVAEIGPDFSLVDHIWDSLAVVSTIALIDECFSEMVDGSALAKCERVSDIEALITRAKAL
jgi:acyl carrier protein